MWVLETEHDLSVLRGEYLVLQPLVVFVHTENWFGADLFLYILLQYSHLFDNVATLFFAIFMGIWGEYIW